MPLIALTGGIASGKSTIARRLASRGAVVVDADATVRELQAPGEPVTLAIGEAFPGVVGADGVLNRAALGGVVFGDPEALARLNAIVHPAVRWETQRRFADAFAADPEAVVVYDVPLLAEARGTAEWDLVVVADAPASMRIGRLVTERGMAEPDARARVANQVGDDERRALADVVIDTSGTLDETLAQADALWERLSR
ncbi:dephospho-CoA kinase [Microbacterium halophytorum]|uniref:dephospho-CoA kinase n=1 Tax=Microbacterium halophytorum TaxID=2067568 RepID=UPI000CFC41D9|nr:dephospho-CoA kinase [Microbacterium halophytorum]